MGIDLNTLYMAAAMLLGQAVMTVIVIGIVFTVANIGFRWARQGLADRRFGSTVGPRNSAYDDPLPGLSEDEYERQRLAAIDLDAEDEYGRELAAAEDAYWRERGY
jgi:hypothetical protein